MRRRDRAYQQAIGHFLLVVTPELYGFSFLNPCDSQMLQENFRMPVDFKKREAQSEGGLSLWEAT